MEKYYTIGETARIMNMTTKALRNYDHIDLLKPSYTDPDTKYRYYIYEQFFTIDLIRYLNKVMYVPLEEIKKLILAHDSREELCHLRALHLRSIRQQIERYEYALQLIDNMVENIINKDTIKQTHPQYEVYLMSRDFYYIELDAPIEEIDKYINRSSPLLIHSKNRENDTIALLFSLLEFQQERKLTLKGFGVFSNEEIPDLKMMRFNEGRFLTHRFPFSEDNCKHTLNDMTSYAAAHDMKLSDYCLLVSKAVDLTAKSKFDYDMEFQIRHYLK